MKPTPTKFPQFAIYERKAAMNSEDMSVIMAPYFFREAAEADRKKYGFDTLNYFVDVYPLPTKT